MITRPLDLASRLRLEPRRFDYLPFLVNGGLIVLFFMLFGSAFVLAPGLEVNLAMPEMAGARASAARTTDVISVRGSGQIFNDEGLITMKQLGSWLRVRAPRSKAPSLLVRADAGVAVNELTEITSVARKAGFVRVVVGALEPEESGNRSSAP